MCTKCRPARRSHSKTTKERGYGNDWRMLSERERQKRPLCEVCDAKGKATPATQCHHIAKISESPDRRMDVRNTLAVCGSCHRIVETLNHLELAQYLSDSEAEQ